MKNISKVMVILLAFTALLTGCKKQSSEKQILTFKFASPAVEAVIDEENKTIVANVPEGTNVTALVPIITISEKATVTPASGTLVDFSNPVKFTVTAEDESQVEYIAIVNVNGGGGNDNAGKILSFKFVAPVQVDATINESAKTITASVPDGTPVTSMTPIITVSEGATVNPASGTTLDFTNPVAYTVTKDGAQTVYTATVTVMGPTDPIAVSGTIDANTTWVDLGLDVDYVLTGTIFLDGNALLTIEPGVTIMFDGVDGGIDVGPNAGLRMVGTADKPIILEGPAYNPNNGSWHNVAINSKRTDNQFEYVQFLRGGSNEYLWDGVVYVYNGRLSMKNCLIDGGLCSGISMEGDECFFTAFEGNTIKNCEGYPWAVDAITTACKNVGTGNSFVNNTYDYIQIYQPYDFTENLTLHDLSIPYYFPQGATFVSNKTLTIEPGVEILLEPNSGIEVQGSCGFIANGTASKPIIFDCIEDGETYMAFGFESTKNNNVINYCQFKNSGTACLGIGAYAKLTLTNNVFGPSDGYGVYIESIESWGNVTQSNNTFVNCADNVFVEYGGNYNGAYYPDGSVLDHLP